MYGFGIFTELKIRILDFCYSFRCALVSVSMKNSKISQYLLHHTTMPLHVLHKAFVFGVFALAAHMHFPHDALNAFRTIHGAHGVR